VRVRVLRESALLRTSIVGSDTLGFSFDCVDTGLLVTAVEEGGKMDTAGLIEGDVILCLGKSSCEGLQVFVPCLTALCITRILL
jgi:hypothetical protein